MSRSDSPHASVTRNTGVMLWSELVIKVFTLAFTVAFARTFGPDGVGRWAYAWTFASVAMTAAHFGLATLFTREAAARPADVDALLGVFLPTRVLLAAAATLAMGVVAACTRDAATRALLVCFTLSLAMSYVTELFAAVFRARQQIPLVAVLTIVDRAIASLLGCAIALLGGSLVATGIGWSAAPVVAAALGAVWITRAGIRWVLDWRWGSIRRVLRASLPLFLLAAFGQIYFRQDVLILRWLTDDATVGQYGAAYRVFEMFLFIPGSITFAYLPAAAAARASSTEAFHGVVERTLTLCLTFAAPIAVLLSLRAGDVMHLLFGDAFAQAVPAARVLAWTALFYFPNAVLAHTLISSRRQTIPAIAIMCAAGLNVLLNLLWIPRADIVGAAYATLVTEGGVFAAYACVVVGRLLPPAAALRSVRPLAAGGVMVLVCALTHAWSLWQAAGIALTVYAALSLALHTIRPDDVRALLPSSAYVQRP